MKKELPSQDTWCSYCQRKTIHKVHRRRATYFGYPHPPKYQDFLVCTECEN